MESSPLYTYVPHRRTEEKLEHAAHAGRVSDQLSRRSLVDRFNAWLAVKITSGVGTMWCAYAFAAIAFVSLPAAISSHNGVVIVSWISQTFLQLFLLSVVIVGQNLLASAADQRAEATFSDADAVIHEVVKLQEHLLAQDRVLARLMNNAAEP